MLTAKVVIFADFILWILCEHNYVSSDKSLFWIILDIA